LLQVVTDDLVRTVALLQPRGVALVETGAGLLGDSGIGHVADKRVVEAEEVVVGRR
jgi:hypothetical protein